MHERNKYKDTKDDHNNTYNATDDNTTNGSRIRWNGWSHTRSQRFIIISLIVVVSVGIAYIYIFTGIHLWDCDHLLFQLFAINK